MTLAEASRQYQRVLEYLRGQDPDEDDELALEEAERAMNTAWLEHTTAGWWD